MNLTTYDRMTYISTILGPQRSLSLVWLIPLTVVYILILIMGVIGNSVTIIVICRFRYMQNITNLYLANLAITDLITLIAVAIVIVFAVCWSPFHAQRLLFLYVSLYSDWTNTLRQINQVLFLVAGCLYYLNSSLNPLIYSILSKRFRAAFSLFVSGCCGMNENHSQSTNGSKNRQKVSGNSGSNSNNSVIIAAANYVILPN